MCGNLEDYVSVTAKVSKSQSKDYEKVLKVDICSSWIAWSLLTDHQCNRALVNQ